MTMQPLDPDFNLAHVAPRMSPVVVPDKKRGMFGGGVGRAIAGTIGDFLLQRSGMQPIYAPMRQQAMQMQAEEDQYQRRRGDTLEDYRQKLELQASMPDQGSPYRWESNDGSLMEMGPDGLVRVVYKDPTPKIGIQMGPDGRLYQTIIGGNQGGGEEILDALPQGARPRTEGGATAAPSLPFRR